MKFLTHQNFLYLLLAVGFTTLMYFAGKADTEQAKVKASTEIARIADSLTTLAQQEQRAMDAALCNCCDKCKRFNN